MAIPHDETYLVAAKTPIWGALEIGPHYYSLIALIAAPPGFKTWLASRPDVDSALWSGVLGKFENYNRNVIDSRRQCFCWAGPSAQPCTGTDYSNSSTYMAHVICPSASLRWSYCSIFYGVRVPPPLPVAAFHGTPLSGLWPLSVAFTDDSTGYISSWLWNFGDGFLSAEKNPTHVYSHAGTFTVVLSVTNPSGTNTITKTNYITVADPPPYVNPIWTLKIGPL